MQMRMVDRRLDHRETLWRVSWICLNELNSISRLVARVGTQCELEETKWAVACRMDWGERPQKQGVQGKVTEDKSSGHGRKA